jgi:hypothetical protein
MLGRRTAPHFGDTAFRYAASHGRTSNPWKNPSRIFQCLEPQAENLPTIGKSSPNFSNAWTRAPIFFQGSEEKLRFFPTFGTLCDSARQKLPGIGTWTTFSSNPRKEIFNFFQGSERRAGILPPLGKSPSNFSRVRNARPKIFQPSDEIFPTPGRPAGRGGAPRCGVPSKTHRLTGTLESFPFHLVSKADL